MPGRLSIVSALVPLALLAAWPFVSEPEISPMPLTHGQTVGFSRCFAPGTPTAVVDEAERGMETTPPGLELFQASTHWNRTATDGGGLSRGDAITLTWGVVPDGTHIPGFGVGDADSSDLRAYLNGLYGDEATWLPIFERVFARWGDVTGITYVYEPNDDGADFSNITSESRGQLGVRPDIRIGGRAIDGNANTLAFNFFPTIGDMVIDTTDNFFQNLSNESLRFRNVVAHEHGHGLGLSHVCPINQTKLMEPFVSTQFDGPQHDDILGGQRQHGDPLEPNDSPDSAANLGSLESTASERNLLSIDGSSDVDVFAFHAPAPNAQVAIDVTPIGETYLEGSQNSNGSCSDGSNTDSTTASDLGIEILDTNGAVLTQANTQGAGAAETLTFTAGESLGPYYIRIHGDGSDAIQLYHLSARAVEISNDLAVSLTASPSKVVLGETQTFQVNVRHSGPGDAEDVVLAITLTEPLIVDAAQLTEGTGSVTIANHSVMVDLGTLSGLTEATLVVETHHVSPGTGTFTATVSKAGSEPVDSNNQATIASIGSQGEPTDVEDFNAFPGLSGPPGSPVPNDTTGFFDLRYNYAATTAEGFALDQTQAPNGRGLRFAAAEDNAMETTIDFPADTYSERQHQLAFWFRFSDVAASPDNSLTQSLFVYNRGASDLAYYLQVGKDYNGDVGANLVVPVDAGNVSNPTHLALAPDRWHAVVVQYDSASDTSSADAGIRMWLNPTDDSAQPDFELRTDSGAMGSFFGDGTFGRLVFGASSFPADPNGPDIWMDRIGIWNGYGESGENDLGAAIQFLYAYVSANLKDSSASVSEDAGAATFLLNRRGDTGLAGNVSWEVVATGSAGVDAADFPGGVFPSGTITFEAGELSKTLSIPIVDDVASEGDELFEVQLESATTMFRLDQTSLFGTIVNDDADATTQITLMDGDLHVRDVGSPSDDTLTIQSDIANGDIVIHDPNHLLGTDIPGASGHGTATIRVPAGMVAGEIRVDAGNGNDQVDIDFTLGAFSWLTQIDDASIKLSGGTFDQGLFEHSHPHGVAITLDEAPLIAGAQIATIESALQLGHATLRYDAHEDALLVSSPSATQTLVNTTALIHPSQSLTIDSGPGNDAITIESLLVDYPATLILEGGADIDRMTSLTPIDLAQGATLVTAFETINPGHPGDPHVQGSAWQIDGTVALASETVLYSESDITFSEGSVVRLRHREGSVPDQWRLSGDTTIDLANATLEIVTSATTPPAGTETVIIACTNEVDLIHPFEGLPEGAVVTSGLALFEITYEGGDGNDIALRTLLDYPQWRAQAFHGAEGALTSQDPTANPDGDDWPNGLEYLLGLDPTAHDADPLVVTVSDVQTTLQFPRALLVPGATETLEWSSDLNTWHLIHPESVTTEALDADREWVTWTLPFDEEERVFYRILTDIDTGE